MERGDEITRYKPNLTYVECTLETKQANRFVNRMVRAYRTTL